VNTLDHEELCHVFVLADGLNVNGTELIKGMVKHLPEGVKVTGGLTGDGGEFKETLTGANQMPESKNVVALGFYGTRLKVHCGSMSGFEPFGPERKITRSENNILYELDGEPDFLAIFAQVSRRVTVLLKTGAPAAESSLSTQKYPSRKN